MMWVESLALAGLIVGLRTLNHTVSTVKMLAIVRHRKSVAAGLSALEALIFAFVFSRVLADTSNYIILVAYCLGGSVGTFIGMVLEENLTKSFVSLNVITNNGGHDIAIALRGAGFGVTEMQGEGRDGKVTMLRSIFELKLVPKAMETVLKINPKAFTALEEERSIHAGWVLKHRRRWR